MRYLYLLLAGALCAMASPAQAEVKPASLFSDGMVLQREIPVPVWGTADKGEKVTVSFRGQEISTVADEQGKWNLSLARMAPGGPWPLTIRGANTIQYKQVFVGDVWLCGGQSNMDMLLGACDHAAEAMSATTPNLHLSWGGGWQLAAGQANGGFSGTGYWFGRYLADEMKDLHIGLIKCAVGGSRPEAWTPPRVLKRLGLPGGDLYKTRLQPLIPYALKGVAWYQGESSTDQPRIYSQCMEAMIAAWREDFNNPSLPFVFMQLPRIGGPPQANDKVHPDDGWALIREAQTFNLSIPNTAMAIFGETTDGDLHPKNKKDAGTRLALAALAKVYGKTPVENYLSPVLRDATLKDGLLTLSFENASQGLQTKGDNSGKIHQFFVVSEDGTQKPAQAKIQGNTLVVDLRGEQGLPDIYYNFHSYSLGNLYNAAGLPVAQFRLAKPKIVVDDCFRDTLILSQSVPFGAHALEPASYRISGYTIRKVEYLRSSAYVRLTVDRPWKIGEAITLELPGFKQWDRQTVFAPLQFIATPGHLAAGGYFREMLVGEFHPKIKPDTCFKDRLVDVSKLDYPSTKTWKIIESDGLINLLEGLGNVENALGFAHVYVYSTADRTVNLWYGSDDGARVYVNKDAINTSEGVRPCIPDMVKVKDVKLNKGWNSVLFEVSQFAGNWGVMARIVDDNGGPVLGIGYQAEKPADHGTVAAFLTDSGLASKPRPDDGGFFVEGSKKSELNWTPGKFAVKQNVYFGNSAAEILSATKPVAADLPATATSIPMPVADPPVGKTYYWRVESINRDGVTATRGDVWSIRIVSKKLRVYLLGGQSNATGCAPCNGLPKELLGPKKSVIVFARGGIKLREYGWDWLRDGLGDGFGDRGKGCFGPELTFGTTMAKARPGEQFAILKCAWGATNLGQQWRPPSAGGEPGPLYKGFVDAVHKGIAALDPAFEPEFAGMIWMQGESDASNKQMTSDYVKNLTAFIKNIRAEAKQPNLPFVLAQISKAPAWGPDRGDGLRAAQLEVARTVPNTATFPTDDYKLCDPWHYDTEGMVSLGERFATAMLKLEEK